MLLNLMRFQVNLRIKHYKLLFQALCVRTQKVVFPEMLFQHVVIKVILWPSLTPPVTDEAPLVTLPTVSVQLIIPVKPLSAEATFWVTLEAGLILCPGMIVSKPLMLPKLVVCKQLMLVREDFLVPRAKITHDFVMHALDMSM